jgi:hypothetical protein
MSFGHVGSVATINNYATAEKFFNSKPAHTRCKDWQSHERCLKERASGNRHYRIEQHNDGKYYDVCLYRTVMARFYAPNEDGHCRVLYAGHSSVTSKSFQSRVLFVWEAHRRTTTEDKEVVVPLYCNNVFYDEGDSFCVDLMFDAEGRLIVDKSKHAPHFTHKSNAEDKAKRVRVKEKFANFIMLAQMRMPEFEDNCTPTHTKGRPFGGGDTSHNERMAVEDIWEEDMPEQHSIDHFFDLCQDAYDVLVSKRGYEQGNFRLGYRYMAAGHGQSSPADLAKPVTEKDLEKAILNRVYRLVGANGGSEVIEQPQFMTDEAYPRTTITSRRA